ncbi:cupin domain-containing protein [Algoriphagus machipongonensis]|uniref:ATP phosphoribosyltransferase n=1 Tax=Algoriphagus machipongonensis TaxID=388413 RepID=A3I0K8_9BACT|nr:phosphomannose isomerase [Algoriphagus machipongonensis]EAZ80004.1 ATP phosphoribosyltransferase [Algoriphagus machipongonensis]
MITIDLLPHLSKKEVFSKVEEFLNQEEFRISKIDQTRPWGGFFVLDEKQILKFKEAFFDEVELSEAQLEQKLSPKFLLVAPGARLSWQYHYRRSEIWKLIAGESAIVRSDSDEQGPEELMKIGETISLAKGERHRLVGTKNWGIVAEIWMHSDPENPSNEEDIVRVEDDYSRK